MAFNNALYRMEFYKFCPSELLLDEHLSCLSCLGPHLTSPHSRGCCKCNSRRPVTAPARKFLTTVQSSRLTLQMQYLGSVAACGNDDQPN